MKTTSNRVTIIFSVVSLMLVSNISYSQSDNENNRGDKLDLQSLQISFINETALYYHNLINEKLSLKSGVSAFWNYDERKDGDGYYKYFNSSSNSEQKSTNNGINNTYEVILSSQLLYNLTEYQYAKMYLGVGPSFIYSLTKYSNNSSNYTDTTYSRYGDESNYTVLGIGPSISILVKTYVYGSISLISEYNFSAFYTRYTDNSRSRNEYKYPGSTPNIYSNESHRESNGWKLKFSNVRVGLLIAM